MPKIFYESFLGTKKGLVFYPRWQGKILCIANVEYREKSVYAYSFYRATAFCGLYCAADQSCL